MSGDGDERLMAELSLVESMYPEQLKWDEHARQLTYSSERSTFTLRLPEEYLESALPYVITANIAREDVSEKFRHLVKACDIGEEILDHLILSFVDLEEQLGQEASEKDNIEELKDISRVAEGPHEANTTVIVWLHHLLNTNKRKQALAVGPDVSGVTKPGYPGVLIYSGPTDTVQEHVNELKQLNWQAFQVRLESAEAWKFKHGQGVVEVEAMKDIVLAIGEERKELFMESMRMK